MKLCARHKSIFGGQTKSLAHITPVSFPCSLHRTSEASQFVGQERGEGTPFSILTGARTELRHQGINWSTYATPHRVS